MKVVFIMLLMIAGASFGADLPAVKSPIQGLQEGIQTKLTRAQIDRILPWAKNAKDSLEGLERYVEDLSKREKNRRLENGVKKIVLESGKSNSTLLLRYVLNRSIVVHNIMKQEIAESTIGSLHIRNRIMESSIILAKEYWKNDLEQLQNKTPPKRDFAEFAFHYSDYLAHLSRSVMDASAQYRIERLNLGFLQWDLYRSTKNIKEFATSIREIFFSLKYISKKAPSSDQLALKLVRKMKKMRLRIREKFADRYENRFANKRKVEWILSANFNACYKMMNISLESHEARAKCTMYIRMHDFVNDAGFKKCYRLVNRSLETHEAVAKCIFWSKTFKFDNNPSFDRCYQIENISRYSNKAVKSCMEAL